jgi:hypothetical protein
VASRDLEDVVSQGESYRTSRHPQRSPLPSINCSAAFIYAKYFGARNHMGLPIQISKACERSAITNVSTLVHMCIFGLLDGTCAFPSHHPSGSCWFCLNIHVSLPPASSDVCHDIGCDDGRLCKWRSSFDCLLVPCRIRVISNKLYIPVERTELN